MTLPSVSEPIPVLHLITRLIVGGAQENTMFTAALLDKQRFKVDVVSGPQTGSEGSLMGEVRQRGVPLTVLSNLVREVHPGKDLLAILKLYHLMRENAYTIVHTHSSKAGILGRLAARWASVPVIVHTVHGWSFHDHMSPRRKALFVVLERLGARVSDAMIVVTERDIEKGLRAGIGQRDQYHLIRSAIPLDQFNPDQFDRDAIRQELGLPLDAPILGNVGRFSPQKNPLDWVRVAGIVGRVLPSCRFILVGDGPLRKDVEAALAEEGILDRTLLTGLRRDVPRFMAAMDVFLLTSLWEGLPRVIPQAMAMRVPVVAYQVDGAMEAIQQGKTGYLCSPGDIEEAASRCQYLLQNNQARQMAGQKGRAFALSEFDVMRMVAQIVQLYRTLMAGKIKN